MGKDRTWTDSLEPPHERIELECRQAVAVEATGAVLDEEITGLATPPHIHEASIVRDLPESFDRACSMLRATRGMCVMIITRPGAGYVIRTTDL